MFENKELSQAGDISRCSKVSNSQTCEMWEHFRFLILLGIQYKFGSGTSVKF